MAFQGINNSFKRICVRFKSDISRKTIGKVDDFEIVNQHQRIKDNQFRIENSNAFEKINVTSRSNSKSDSKSWNGNESIHDSTLRMIMDSHKPLRISNYKKPIQQPLSNNARQRQRSYEENIFKPIKKSNNSNKILNAKDASFDYKVKKTPQKSRDDFIRPATLSGYRNLIEERIDRARTKGEFKNLKGHGKPIKYDPNDHNPFLDQSTKIMNNIVKRQGAIPLWVEAQQIVDKELVHFRQIIRSDWLKHATESFLNRGQISQYTIDHVYQFRDYQWQNRNEKFHESFVKLINEKIRSYNLLAPQTVRRGYVVLEVELERAFQDCEKELCKSLENYVDNGYIKKSTGESGIVSEDELDKTHYGFLDWLRGIKRGIFIKL